MPSQQQTSNTVKKLRDSWQTPQWLFEWANELFGFDFDLTASSDNFKCTRFFDIEDNALNQCWYREGDSFWLNPPYSETGKYGRWLAVVYIEGKTLSEFYMAYSQFLAFPTEEIRDTFLKNHRELIMKAKALL